MFGRTLRSSYSGTCVVLTREPMRILFVTSTRIGDAVITTGILNHLIQQHPDCRVTVVCGRVAEGVFSRMPNLERILLIDKLSFDRHWLELWRRVVGRWWDLVVDLRGSALAYCIAARRRVVSRRLPGRKYEQLGALLRIVPPPLPVVWTSAADRARAAALLPSGRPRDRAGTDRQLGTQDLARRALRSLVP